MTFLFTGRKFGLPKRGGYTVTKRFCEWFVDITKFVESSEITKNDLHKYQKVIFRTQIPTAYPFPVNGLNLRGINHLVYIRGDRITPLLNSCTNGFNYYQRYKTILNYIPMITPFSVEKIERDIPCLGFYIRNYITKDSFDWFRNLVDNINTEIDVYFIGELPKINFQEYKCVRSVTHTFNNIEFFSNVTHYIYPRSRLWDDPFPHSMVEAIQSGCQIISPLIPERKHVDGVDDVLSCIKYHTTFDLKVYHDNSKSTILSDFKPFYERVFSNDFEYSFDRDKYTTFNEWIKGEVI